MANLIMEFSEDEIQMILYIFSEMATRQNEGSLTIPPYINNERLQTLLQEGRQSIDEWYGNAEEEADEENNFSRYNDPEDEYPGSVGAMSFTETVRRSSDLTTDLDL